MQKYACSESCVWWGGWLCLCVCVYVCVHAHACVYVRVCVCVCVLCAGCEGGVDSGGKVGGGRGALLNRCGLCVHLCVGGCCVVWTVCVCRL